MKGNKLLGLFALLFLGFSLNLAFGAGDDRTARLRYSTGDVTLNPSDGQRGSEAVANSPVLDGDEIETGNGRAEVSFRNGVVIRIGDYSNLKVNSVYHPMSIELIDGTVFVDSGNIGSLRDELEVVSAGAEIYMISEGTFRIDHGSQGSVRVTSAAGEAEVRAAGRRVLLEAGERTYVDPGQPPDQPEMYSENYDELDSWNESRGRLYARQDDNRYVDESVYYDSSDLHGYGDWRPYETYGYVWVPRVSVGWRPYLDGYWSYCNGGWFWVSYEPWGWAPYHYGRWGWSINFGWYWIPGDVFAPSWVSWYYYGDYVGWCPLNYWNQPVYFNGYYYGHHYLPTVQKQKTLDVGNAWTFVKKDQVGAGNLRNISLGVSDVKKIQMEKNSLRGQPDGSLVDYVLPKARSTSGIPNAIRIDKDHGTSGFSDIKNHQNETVFRTNPGTVSKDTTTPGKVPPDIKQKQQNWEQDRTHSTTKEPVNNPPVVKKQQSWKDYTKDDQFDHGKDSGSLPAPSWNTKHNGGQETVTPKNQQWNDFDRDDQFKRNGDTKSPTSGSGSSWFRDQENSAPTGNGGENQKEISPRYTDDVKKMFDYFNWGNSDKTGGGNDNGKGQYHYTPPKSGSSGSGGSHKYSPPSGGSSHGSGAKPKNSGSQTQPPPKPKH